MKEIRIEPVTGLEGCVEVDVMCDCGTNGLLDETAGRRSFRHPVYIGGGNEKKLSCPKCGKKYLISSRGTHFHVLSI